MSRHGGNEWGLARDSGRKGAGRHCAPESAILDFSAGINPLGPPECLRPVISRHIECLGNYPDPDAVELTEAISRHCGAPRERGSAAALLSVVVGNGSSELLFALARALGEGRCGAPERSRALIPVPSRLEYVTAARRAGLAVETLPLDAARGLALDWPSLGERITGGEIVFLGQPNDPTGLLLDPAELRRFAAAHAAAIFVVDEAFAQFIDGYPSLMKDVPPNVVVLRSLSKFYAIPGLRLGFAVATAALCERIRRQLPPWPVNTLAQAAGAAMLADEDYARRTRLAVRTLRESLARALSRMPGLRVFPGTANFLLVRMDRADGDAHVLARRLLDRGIAIRTFAPEEHLDHRYFQVAVRTEAENARLCDALALGEPPKPASTRRRAASLMFQGTSSNAGKSVLTAAICRILLQDGRRVAPFKAQNMSLNSFVTRDGGEMGRAQVVQAQACRIEPDVRMNPILLKPDSDTGCQVIVRGRPIGNLRAAGYDGRKTEVFEAVKTCYDSLAEEFDVVVLEGAGSPGEVNLKSQDIVNMRMAEYAGAPVLIVGDIDRGGVFASFVGTLEVLDPWERALVAGWVVNKFRGDAALLGSALDYTLRHTGRPVLGVVPYLRDLGLPEEDSVEFKSGAWDDRRGDAEAVTVALVDLPHISNFTDFDALRIENDVRLRIVREADDLGEPDAVILPGSKNVLGDLDYLRRSGMADRLLKLAAGGLSEIVGICGGLQMLGTAIQDPHGIESAAGSAPGLGLLPGATVLAPEKTLVRATGLHVPSGCRVAGYEIHHGRTDSGGAEAVIRRDDGEVIGIAAAEQRVWGTYLHGIFDADEFRRWFLDRLRVRRGLPPVGQVSASYDIEPALDRLAAVVRLGLDMNRIYALLDRR